MKQWSRTVITSLLLVAMLFTVCAFSACEGNGGSGDDAAKIEELTQQLSEAAQKLKEAEAEVERLGEQVEALKMTVGGTDNIDYMLSTDGSSYIAIGPKEGCTDSHFEIATVYEGLPVTEVGDQAFMGYNQANLEAGTVSCVIRSVSIPSTVRVIGEKAFAELTELKDATFGGPFDGTTGKEAFISSGLEFFKFPAGQIRTPEGFLRSNHSLKTVILPDGMTTIGVNCFFDCTEIRDLYFPDSITHIEFAAFWGSFYITIANWPTNLEYLGKEAFYYCVKIACAVHFGPNFKYFGANALYAARSLESVTFEVTDGWYYTKSENTTPGAADTTAMPQEKMTGDLHDLLRKPETEEPTAMGDYFFIHA